MGAARHDRLGCKLQLAVERRAHLFVDTLRNAVRVNQAHDHDLGFAAFVRARRIQREPDALASDRLHARQPLYKHILNAGRVQYIRHGVQSNARSHGIPLCATGGRTATLAGNYTAAVPLIPEIYSHVASRINFVFSRQLSRVVVKAAPSSEQFETNERTAARRTVSAAVRPFRASHEGHGTGEALQICSAYCEGSCTGYRGTRINAPEVSLSDVRVNLLSVPTAKIGSVKPHTTCWVRTLVSRSISQPGRRKAVATNTQPRKSRVTRRPKFYGSVSEVTGATNGSLQSWTVAERNGGSNYNEQDGSLTLSRPSNSSRGGVEGHAAWKRLAPRAESVPGNGEFANRRVIVEPVGIKPGPRETSLTWPTNRIGCFPDYWSAA